MSTNLLYREYKTACYNYNNNGVLDRFAYNNSETVMACYFADLSPNTTYTIQRIDSSARFRVATYTNDVKTLNSTSSSNSYDYSVVQYWLTDNSNPITFTTGQADIYLVVYYTNNSEYSTRVMLNEGSEILPYEKPTKYFPWTEVWSIVDEELTNKSFTDLTTNYLTKPYPVAMWAMEGDSLMNNIPAPLIKSPTISPYPKAMWAVDNDILLVNLPEPLTKSFAVKPYAKALWQMTDDTEELQNNLPEPIQQLGAFCHSTNLVSVKIPNSNKSIGEYTFKETKIKSITISEDCTYYEDSFPEGCEVSTK